MSLAVQLGLVLLVSSAFGWDRLRLYLRYFQQEEYDNRRFLRWLWQGRAFDRRASLLAAVCVLLALLLSWTAPDAATWAIFCYAAGVLCARRYRKAKKPLVKTERAKRIQGLALGLFVVFAGCAVTALYQSWVSPLGFAVSVVVSLQIPPFLLVMANIGLSPAEARVKARFRAEAKAKLAALQPRVIAITGSFGKTSVKHILGHILQAAGPTLITPGSVNTEMGITRIIREKLTADHRYFVVEMGAYGPGSIARLCALTPPHMALITAVGEAHYERFKSLEAVAEAKFEIAEACFEQAGTTYLLADGIPEALREAQMRSRPGDYRLVSSQGTADIRFHSAEQTVDGTRLTLIADAGEIVLSAPLFGRHQAGNIAVAAAAANGLGLPWDAIRGALSTTPQVAHRLAVSRTSGGPTIIDDAYNANPKGFAAALELLDLLREADGRRIIITPGMVELGTAHDRIHQDLGDSAARHADIVFAVTPERIPTFTRAIEAADTGCDLRPRQTQAEAEAEAKALWRAGDVVLFANNLPDLFEQKLVL